MDFGLVIVALLLPTNLASVFVVACIWTCSGFTGIVMDFRSFNLGDLKSHIFITKFNIHAATH